MLKESAPTQLELLPATFVPAHVAVKDKICSRCRVPVRVQREPIPHITVPLCEACTAVLGGAKPREID